MDKDTLFNELKSKHPDWSDEQIWTNVSVMISAGDVITTAGPTPPLVQELLGIILNKAKQWLLETLPDIFCKVADFFDDMIADLPDWAKKGIEYVFKMIIKYYSGQYTY